MYPRQHHLAGASHLSYTFNMRRSNAIVKLRSQARALRALGVTHLYLFGSTARNEANGQSDIDVFYEYSGSKFSLINVVRIKRHLESELGVKVDAIPRDSIHPRLKSAVQQSAVRIY
jgi:predicted nucleotidyltransferase